MACFISELLFLTMTVTQVLASKRSSLTLVVDTTESMRGEIDVLKSQVGSVLNVIRGIGGPSVGNFVLVPFNDPDVLQPAVTPDPGEFSRIINRLSTSGGDHECPENSLAGIQRALEISQPESKIFVFTDAYAKDASNIEQIRELCAATRSQVTIFLSGKCVPVGTEPVGDVEVFNEIAAACSGILFHFETSNLRQAFSFIKKIVAEDMTEMTVERTSVNANKELTFPVNSYTSSLMVAAVGDYPSLDVNQTEGVERIIHTRHASVIRITSMNSQEYNINIRSRGNTTLTTYTKRYFPFKFGFSTMAPRSFEETSLRPIPGWANYLLLAASVDQALALSSIEVSSESNINGTIIATLAMEQTARGYYLVKEYYYPQTPFKITVFGENSETFQQFNLTSTLMQEQQAVKHSQWTKPRVEILDHDVVIEYGTGANLTCKIFGYPAPTVNWDGESISNVETKLLEIPSVYLSRLTLEKVTSNATYCCAARNADGEHAACIEVYVHRDFVFEVLQKPEDKTVEYGSEGQLYCQVNAYPEATIKWLFNDTSVDYNTNLALSPEENALKIKNMSMNEVGLYVCEISNTERRERYPALVSISGIDPPRIDKNSSSEVNLKTGLNSEFECRILQGNPSPQISWKFYSDDGSTFTEIPSDIYVRDGKLQFVDVKREYRGVYRCEARNIAGSDYWDFTAKVLYAPIIKETTGTITVREGASVEIPCEVDADPAARVRWEMNQDDVIHTFDERHTTDQYHTHRFIAYSKDSGSYHCVAENEIGKTVKTVEVIVQVAPYIQPPEHQTITARVGSTVTLHCTVQVGNPAPTTVWRFESLSDTPTVLKRGTMSNTLELTNVTAANQGSYFCIATNVVNNDSIKIDLKVK